MLRSDSEGLISGRPILHAEGQFVVCHYSPSQYVPCRKIGRRHFKEILRRATGFENCDKVNFEIHKKEKSSRIDEFEMISLSDSCTEEESCTRHVYNKTGTHKDDQKTTTTTAAAATTTTTAALHRIATLDFPGRRRIRPHRDIYRSERSFYLTGHYRKVSKSCINDYIDS
ncbi:hypothetical protein OS493_025797 [Desmophyllum pertusum]|uniref:Uncharacterized protein n=1 Tax=Desmophyllum pertusum TaxID=174260 RepID=A0A9W9ZC72_9CNID|nr:hypothetical protein OS493_025797 [Desmophyllum pertusum]